MIFGVIKSTFISLGAAFVAQCFLHQIQTDFVHTFLRLNITNLQVALLAVNSATLGIVLTKIRELMDKTGEQVAFNSVRNEMLLSIKEQMALIAISLLILAAEDAKRFPFEISADIFRTVLIATFVYTMIVLYDTAKSVFVILDYKQK